MKVENPLVHPCRASNSSPHQLRALAERTGWPLGHKLREGCQVETTFKTQEEPETARASSCQRGAECCPDTGPSQAQSTVAKHPRSVLCLPYSDSRSVVAFTDERPAFHKVGSAKNWKPLYWPVQPRPPRGPASFPFPCEEERRPSWGARHTRVRNFPEGPCTPWTTKTLTAGAAIQGTPAAPHIRDGRSDCGTDTLLSAIVH